MKNLIAIILIFIGLTSCKKATSNSSSTSNSTSGGLVFKTGSGTKDIEGNMYKTVIIGTQEWMAENLKVKKHNDGSVITKENGQRDMNNYYNWMSIKKGVWCNHLNMIERGVIYNGYIIQSNDVCPTGYHIPSKAEWSTLIEYLGGTMHAGIKLKKTGYDLWQKSSWSSDTATNVSGFTATPTGNIVGGLNVYTIAAWYWTSELKKISIDNDGGDVGIHDDNYDLTDASAIRCLKN